MVSLRDTDPRIDHGKLLASSWLLLGYWLLLEKPTSMANFPEHFHKLANHASFFAVFI